MPNASWITRLRLTDPKLPPPTKSDAGKSAEIQLKAEEVLWIRHHLFLPEGRLFESLDEAHQWLRATTDELNQPGGFRCFLNDNIDDEDSQQPPPYPTKDDDDDDECPEKILLGQVCWLAAGKELSGVPIYGRKLIRFRHPFPIVSGQTFSLFKSAKDAQAWGQSVQDILIAGSNGASVPLLDPSVFMFEPRSKSKKRARVN